MKSILFVLPHMLGRGVEKSLLSLLDLIPREKYSVTIMFVEIAGEFLDKIPREITITQLPLNRKLREEIIHPIGTKRKLKMFLKEKKYYLFTRQLLEYIKKNPLGEYSADFANVPIVQQNYDIAICYHLHCFFLISYVATKIKAKEKYIWVHNDFTNTAFDISKFQGDLNRYDKIFCVSQAVKNDLISRCEKMQGKIYLFYNFVPREQIIDDSYDVINEEYIRSTRKFKILTVGSIEYQKGIDIALQICTRLVNNKYEVLWIVLGDGSKRKEISKEIEKLGLNDSFILLGVKKNPYPYYKWCDLYVQPSRYEGYGIALEEARIFNCPIVSTDFSGAYEQLSNGVTGSIVSVNEDQLFTEIRNLIDHKEQREKYTQNLMNTQWSRDENERLALFLK